MRTRAKYIYPTWSFTSFAAFQQQKRRDIRAVREALADLRSGSVYLPGYDEGEFQQLMDLFKKLDQATRRGVWRGKPL